MTHTKRKMTGTRRRWRPLLTLLAAPWIILVLTLLALRWLPPPVSAFMLQSETRPVHYRWIDWTSIPASAPLAAVAAEDQRFPHHYGFDFNQISAAIDAHQDGRPLRGASTISQQTCKNLFLWSGGGLFRKVLEAVCTAHLETLLPKRRILEIYLNIAELGPGIYGIEAAAQAYYQRSATMLTAADFALIMAALPSPRRYSLAAPTDYMRQRQQWIRQQMRQLGNSYLTEIN